MTMPEERDLFEAPSEEYRRIGVVVRRDNADRLVEVRARNFIEAMTVLSVQHPDVAGEVVGFREYGA